jgi:hypothetical protein
MKLRLIALVPLLLGCVSCAALLTARRQPWTVIQSVGGLRVDEPVRQPDGSVFLPVVCNISGLDTITVKPTMINSAWVVKKIAVKCRKGRIQIQVVTCVADNKHTSVARGVVLGEMPAGTYQVEYLNTDGSTVGLREIMITDTNRSAHGTR